MKKVLVTGADGFIGSHLTESLLEKGYDEKYGARPLRRTIQKELEDPMATKIIDSYEHPITQVKATVEDGAIRLYTL